MNVRSRSFALLLAATVLLASAHLGGVVARAQDGSGESKSKSTSSKPKPKPRPRRSTRRPSVPTTNSGTNFSGVSIRVVYIRQRLEDARRAATRLRGLGAEVILYETSDSGNGDWVGRIVYWEGQEGLANRIASSVADIEVVTPKFVSDTEGKRQFYLWIARNGTDTEISLAGTTWAGPDSTGDNRKFTFTPNGQLNNIATDTWRQEGNKVYWEINNGYSHYEGTINGDRIDYKAYNKVNLHWTGTLTRAPASTTPNTNANENFKGASIRIVHIHQRLDDAQVAAERLRSLGAEVTLYETSDSGNGDWVGRIVYWEGQESLAGRIASSVADIEVVTPKFVSDTEGKRTFYLWIARKK